MAKSFFFMVQTEEILEYMNENLNIDDIQEKESYYWACNRKLQIKKIESLIPRLPNVVLVEDITPQGEIVPDEKAREVFAALKKKFGRPRKEVEEYYFPGQELA